MKRPSDREFNQLRPISFERQYTKHAEGSVLTCYGHTKVLCTATVEEGVPRWLRQENQGWITAEYGMLPRSTHERMAREAARGKQSGRTLEIQRLIGRSLRAAVNLELLGQNTITVDCDVIQADGGTRTAAISGACIAIYDALQFMLDHQLITTDPFVKLIAAVSVGFYEGAPIIDLDYIEDSNAHTDMNVVMDELGNFIEVQGTAEAQAFNREQLNNLLDLAEAGISEIIQAQTKLLRP